MEEDDDDDDELGIIPSVFYRANFERGATSIVQRSDYPLVFIPD